MKISSWNVNSVRARITNIINYIKDFKPDILLIQEIKTEEKNFPYTDFKNLGYESYVFGQKSYNGVAFLSKIKIDEININFLKDKNKQSRIITGNIKNKSKNIKLINVYIPNGNPIETEKYDYKKEWYDLFIKKVKKALTENENSPAFLVFVNYEKILKWNRSLRFGAAVCTLANMIKNEI